MMTRTDRRRFPVLFAAIAALALAMTLLFSPVQAQEGSAPDKPTGLSATATHDQVVLTWDDPGDASITGYVILRRVRVNNTGGEFSELVPDTGTAATTYTDATVKANTTYTYRIKATNEHGVSERSRWFHIDIPAAPERPDQPTGLDATATHDQVVLTWDDPDDASITGYVILRRVRENDVGGEFSVLVADTGAAATTYTDDSVAADTTYTYRIKAINEHGVSERSRWFHIDTPAAPEAVEGDEQDGEGDGGGTPGGPGKRTNVPEGGTDCPATNATTCEVDVGGSATGEISSGTDKDWFKVVLEADTRYQIDLEGEDTSRGTLGDPFLALRHPCCVDTIVGSRDQGVGDNARLIYTPAAPYSAGVFYLTVEGAASTTGTYTVSVILLGANGVSEADTDFPDTTSTSGRVDVGASVTGNIASAGDIDLFAVTLVAGRTYQFDMEGSHNGRGTLEDPYLTLSDGALSFIAENGDINATNLNSQFIYTATAAGTYYLEAVELSGTSTGTYTLSVRKVGDPPDDSGDPPADSGNVSEGDGEDLPEGITTTGKVEVGGSVTGEIDPALDVDWFAVELKKGKRYQFDVEGADTGRGNLADPHLWGLQDAGGQAVLGVRSNDGGVGKNGRDTYTPSTGGSYYIAVAGAVSTTGTYTLSVIVLGANGVSEADTDFPATTGTTGRVEVGASATGNIESTTDVDWFRVDLEAGKRYQFDLEGEPTERGILEDPVLRLYDDSSDVIATNDDGGEGLNSRLTYTSTAEGTYYIAVSGAASTTGTYTLSVRRILVPVAVPPGGLGPSEVPGAVRNVEVSGTERTRVVYWDAPDETQTGAQWITEFRIYASTGAGCDGWKAAEYEVEHPGFTTPPEHPDGTPTGFRYFKIVVVASDVAGSDGFSVQFGVSAVNELGEGDCVGEPAPPPPDPDDS